MRKQLTRKLLQQWNETIPDGLDERIQARQSRRDFLKAASLLPAAMLVASCDQTSSPVTSTTVTPPILDQAPWRTFAAVQNHLFPKDTDSPGADDINATLYLKSVLELPGVDDEDKKFIRQGVKWINDIAMQMHEKSFYQLSEANKEAVLQRIATSSAGENWLSMLLLYLFEALLTDPVYGGNTNKVGWQWLEHKPGFPAPPEDKRYYLLT